MKFLRSIRLELRRNSAETIDSIWRLSSRDFECATLKNPLYRASTCFCNPEIFGPLEAPIASSCQVPFLICLFLVLSNSKEAICDLFSLFLWNDSLTTTTTRAIISKTLVRFGVYGLQIKQSISSTME
ncbi:unnamed protein product [Ilex paraguariensis]|uniref:Uncharacterized protein n=1 Tax=Ilex paraguariensis TaxID=185542 RepID=A0ABC8S080_9AQUA